MDFPQGVSFTITNRCNLRCKMCGQWSEEGYVRAQPESLKHELELADWKRLVDELAAHQVQSLLLRGGEPFLLPGIMELIRTIREKGISLSIDTNGTQMLKFAEEIVEIGGFHMTISLDGTEKVHDAVRGVQGTFARIREGVARLHALEEKTGNKISLSFNYTISPYSIDGLAELPADVQQMGVKVIAIVPYYYFPEAVGEAYEQEMQKEFACKAYSWVGFHHEQSGVDFERFRAAHQQYLAGLGDIYNFPYMAFSDDEYRTWFADAVTPVRTEHCSMVEKYIDIQPNGEANFCIDFPDYAIGNVREASIAELWNGERAERFRAYRREKPLAICQRCGAKYMAEM